MTTQKTLQVPGFEHRSARNGDVEIHYVVAGEGDPVILLHGFPETWFAWRELIPPLAATHRIIAPDLRGLGESSRPSAGYEKKTIATDIEAVIRTEGLSSYHLVGADMGGTVGFPLAMTGEAKVRSFVFIASALPGVGLERLYDYSTVGVGAWYWTLFQHPVYGPLLTEGRERDLLTTWAYRGSALRPNAISDEAIEEYLSHYGQAGGWEAALKYYTTLDQDADDNRALLADGRLLRMPTLGIDGEQDGHLSTATLAQVASDVRGVLIPDCKHWVAEEQPELLAQTLLSFFSQIKSPAAGHDL